MRRFLWLPRPVRAKRALVPLAAIVLVFAGAAVLVRDALGAEEAPGRRAPAPGSILPPFDFGGAAEVRPGTAGGRPAPPPSSVRVRPVPGQLIVKFKPGTPQAVIDATLARVGAEPERKLKIGARVLDVAGEQAADALAALDASPAVEYVERDIAVHQLETTPNDTLWATQWGLVNVGAPAAWDAVRGSPSAVVAVLDTGIDPSHPDLQGALVPGFDFVNNEPDGSDDHGHGTAAAGVIAARTNNVQGQAGVCWSCSLMPVKVLDSTGSGTTSWVASGIVWAVDHGAQIISMSLGGAGSTQTLADAVAYAAAKGAVLVAAAGNSASETQFYPAAYPQVLSVAGTTTANERYSWSNYGSWVKLAAPGCNTAPARGGGYVNFCGTSSATPIVSGLAGLALSMKPSATSAEVEQAITATATPLSGVAQHGRVNAHAALARLGASFGPPPPPSTSPAPTLRVSARGALTARARKRILPCSIGAGPVAAQVTFRGVRRATLRVVDGSGRTVARARGRSPLRLASTLPVGTYNFIVSVRSTRRMPFRLTLIHVAP